MSNNIQHKHADVIKAFADGKTIQFKTDVLPNWNDFNVEKDLVGPWNCDESDNWQWRIKPREINLNGQILPLPATLDKMIKDQIYWSISWSGLVEDYLWTEHSTDFKRLNNHNVFLTQEDATIVRDAWRKLMSGE